MGHSDMPDGTRNRLVQAMLAVPLAALIGFGASMVVRTVRVDAPPAASPSTRSPRPAEVQLERPAPSQRSERGGEHGAALRPRRS